MTIKEVFDSHLKKSSVHHSSLANSNLSLSKAHENAAHAHTDQVVAQAYRDIAKCYSELCKAHEQRQEDFDNLREALAEASGADVLDSRRDSTRDMQHALARDGFLKAIGVLRAD
jgi:hypothetical protein